MYFHFKAQKHKNIMFTIQSKLVLLYVAKKSLYEEIPTSPPLRVSPLFLWSRTIWTSMQFVEISHCNKGLLCKLSPIPLGGTCNIVQIDSGCVDLGKPLQKMDINNVYFRAQTD